MLLRLSRASRFVLGLALFFSAMPSTYAQYEEMANLDADSAATAQLVAKSPYVVKAVTDKEITERLGQMSSCLELRNTKVVKSYIMHYLYRPEKTKSILSKMVMYFPMFEQKLREHEVPDALKYLSVVESALNANAVSRVGASGLWQFMPATGLDYGMQINSAIDERNNVVKSTEGAAKYLKHLYNKYNDWALALAAYNSGPNRVDGAIRRAGSRNFWMLQRFLPEETRNYVPAFIAATYICNFFNEHNLHPEFPELDLQITDHITVYDGISFSAIAKATGLTYKAVSELNPGFRRAYIPPSKRGYFLTLPKRVMPAMIRHLNSLGGNTYKLDSNHYNSDADLTNNGSNQYFYTTINVAETNLADEYASKIGASGVQLRAWNRLTTPYVYANQSLKVWHPVHVIKHMGGIDVAANKTETPAAPVKIDPKVKAQATPAGASKPTAPVVTTATKPNANGGSTTVTTYTRPASASTIQAATGKPVANNGGLKPIINSANTAATTTTATKPVTTTSQGALATTTAVKPTTTSAPVTRPAGTSTGAPQKQYQFHKIKDNESMADLSRRYGVSMDALILLNNTADVKPGMLVKIKELK